MNIEVMLLKNFNFSILKCNNYLYIYTYNNTYSTLLKNSINNKLHLCNTSSLLLIISSFTKNTISKNNFKTIFRNFTAQFVKYKTYKIKFTGKGYKIKKPTKKSFRFLFNKSHICIIWWKNIHFKKYKKYKTYIRSINLIKNTINKILKIRKIDIFTKKGLRISKTTIFKKKGKK